MILLKDPNASMASASRFASYVVTIKQKYPDVDIKEFSDNLSSLYITCSKGKQTLHNIENMLNAFIYHSEDVKIETGVNLFNSIVENKLNITQIENILGLHQWDSGIDVMESFHEWDSLVKLIPDLKAFTHAPDVGYITGGSRDANLANFDFFKLANDDKIICTCYVSNDHYGPVKQFKNGFIFDVDDTKQYVGYGTDIWSIGKNIPDIVIEYFRDRGIASAKNRGAKFEQRAYISEQLKSILYPEDTSFSGKIKKWADNLFTSTKGLSNTDLQYIQRLDNIKTQLRGKPFTMQNIENIDPEFAQAYKTFLDSNRSILVDTYHNEVLVSNPKISAIFTSDIDKIPEEYLKKAQEEDLPIIIFKSQE